MKKININGEIISNNEKEIYDWYDIDSTSPDDVSNILDTLDPNEELEIRVSSPGGNVFDGFKIYTLLKEWTGKTTTKILSLAGSASSTIAMAGDIIKISPVGQIMIHNAIVGTSGNKEELANDIKTLESIDSSIRNAYKLKTGLSDEKISELMANETYMTAQQCLELNFVDEILFNESNIITNSASTLLSKETINKTRNIIAKDKMIKNKEKEKIIVAKEKAKAYLSISKF